jgi:hypothetical protein
LGNNSLATNWFADASFTNEIADPMLTGISRTNVGSYLDPRPTTASPAASNYVAAPGSLTAANYRGAFAPNAGNWAANWTALSEYHIMGGPGYNPPVSTSVVVAVPNQPILAPAMNGANLDIVFASQTGFNYQLQSTTNLSEMPVIWVDVGSPLAGTGGALTSTVPMSESVKLFRIKAQ